MLVCCSPYLSYYCSLSPCPDVVFVCSNEPCVAVVAAFYECLVCSESSGVRLQPLRRRHRLGISDVGVQLPLRSR